MLSEICPANCGRWCLVELMVTERMLEPSRFPVISEAVPEVKVADPYCINVWPGTSSPQREPSKSATKAKR